MGFSPMRLAETFGVGEIPSGNAYANAQGLAIIGAAMANKGVFKETKVKHPLRQAVSVPGTDV